MNVGVFWRHLVVTVLLAIGCVFANGFWSHPLRAYTSTYRSAANPYDNDPDTAALQDCLDNYDVVILEPAGGAGYVGYIINDVDGDGLQIRTNGRGYGPVLMTNGDGANGKAVLIAATDLDVQLVDVPEDDPYDWEIHQIVLDGNRYNRIYAQYCGTTAIHSYGDVDSRWGSNLIARGNSFQVVGVESDRAMCGTGMQVNGESFTISSTGFYDNGGDAGDYGSAPAPWADGLTLLRCDGGYVHDNVFTDNTDVDLMVANGDGCGVAHNSILNTGKVGFAGLQIGAKEGDLPSLNAWDNGIYSNQDLLQAGLVIGMHPWDNSVTATTVGEIWDISVDGTVDDMIIDGIAAGYVHDISLSRNRGSNGLFNGGCSSYDYTAGHFGSATIPSGYTSLVFDGGYCHTP